VSEHFQHLYNNTNDALDKWAGFWEFTAQQLGPIPSVIGYDYMNEPWVGDYIADPTLLLPGPAGRGWGAWIRLLIRGLGVREERGVGSSKGLVSIHDCLSFCIYHDLGVQGIFSDRVNIILIILILK
jgi:hypothetical protein